MNLLDTDMVIELIRQGRYEAGSISIITIIEVLRGIESKKEVRVKELLEKSFNILNLDNDVIKTYCSLFRRLKVEGASIPDADLIIAATAITHNMTLRTGDEHFKRLL